MPKDAIRCVTCKKDFPVDLHPGFGKRVLLKYLNDKHKEASPDCPVDIIDMKVIAWDDAENEPKYMEDRFLH